MLFMGIVNKSNKSKTPKELANEVVSRCNKKLQEVENVLNTLQPQYELQKKLEQVKTSLRSSSSNSLTGDHDRIGASLNDPARDEKVKIMNQYREATIQQKRCTVYTNFAKKVQRAFDSSK
jgi:hypothetical protein